MRWHLVAQAEAALRLPALIEAERTVAGCTQSESQRLILPYAPPNRRLKRRAFGCWFSGGSSRKYSKLDPDATTIGLAEFGKPPHESSVSRSVGRFRGQPPVCGQPTLNPSIRNISAQIKTVGFPLGVIRVALTARRSLPVLPDAQTFQGPAACQSELATLQ